MSKHRILQPGRGWVCCVVLMQGLACFAPAETPEQMPSGETPTEPDESLVDRAHDAVSEFLVDQAHSLDQSVDEAITPAKFERSRAFDRFFGDRRREDEKQRTRILVAPSLELSEGGGLEPDIRFSAKLDLPRSEHRLQLVANNIEEDRDPLTSFAGRRTQDREPEGDDDTSLALRAQIAEYKSIRYSADAGLKFRPEPIPKLKLRAIKQWKREAWRVQVSQSLFWESDDGFGEKTSLDTKRSLSSNAWVQASTGGVWSESSQGIDLGQSFAWHHLSETGNELVLRLGVAAHTEPNTKVDEYAVRFLYRRPTGKDWIFLEVEPGVDFPADRDYKFSPLIIVRIEFQFGALNDI